MEEWRIVQGFEKYQVSSLGNVKNASGLILKQSFNKRTKYMQVGLHNGKTKKFDVHRLVAKAFIENTECKCCVNHINSIRLDNRVDNLSWVTHSENNQHAYDFGNKKVTQFEQLKPYYFKRKL